MSGFIQSKFDTPLYGQSGIQVVPTPPGVSVGIQSGGLGINFFVSGLQLSGLIQSGGVGSGAVIGQVGDGYFNIGSGSISRFDIGSGQIVSGLLASGQIGQFALASGIYALVSGSPFDNKLVNGGLWFAQAQTPTVLTSITSGISGTDNYSADQWKVACSSGSSVLYQQWDRLVSGWSSGITNRYYGLWQGFGSGEFVIYQSLGASDSQDLANKYLSFQAQIETGAASSGLILQMGILQTNSGVTADAIPNSIVSGWTLTSSGTNPTWGSGVSLLGAGIVVPTSGIWNIFSTKTYAVSGHVNLIPAIWTNQPLSSGSQVFMSELGLYVD